MEPIFNLPYSEYRVILQLSKILKKKDGYGFYIPLSRQQKGVDFLIFNHNSKKKISFQIKSSRAYEKSPPKREPKTHRFQFYLWFTNFSKSYVPGIADFYLLHGLFPKYAPAKTPINSKKIVWSDVMLLYTDREMQKFLNGIRNKKNSKRSPFFGFGFDEASIIFLTRGAERQISVTKHLLSNKITKLF